MFQVSRSVWLPFVVPYVLFVLLTSLEPYAPNYPVAYGLKIALVTASIAYCWRLLPLGEPLAVRWTVVSIVAGILLLPLWVGIDDLLQPFYKSLGHFLHLSSSIGARTQFNPNKIHSTMAKDIFLAVRVFGLSVTVPIAEEVLYRGFISRAVADQDDFRRVPIGYIGWPAMVVTTILFATSHPEWGSAIIFNAAMLLLTAKSKNLRSPIIAHAVTNFCLAVYVLTTHQYRFW